jgi:hypothetical protein
MMGVGFARESGQQVHGTPDFNAFLTVTQIRGPDGRLHPLPGNWRNGYVVTARGVYLGLNGAVTGNAAFAKLAPNPAYSTPEHPEWMATPMTITVNGASAEGHLLMDTGVNVAYLSPPPRRASGRARGLSGGALRPLRAAGYENHRRCAQCRKPRRLLQLHGGPGRQSHAAGGCRGCP